MTVPAEGFRFRPPPTELAAELVWLLQAAFAPTWRSPPPGCDPAEIGRLAARFDLGPRIVARHGADRPRRWLGPAGEVLIRSHRRAVAGTLANERLAEQVAGEAGSAGTPKSPVTWFTRATRGSSPAIQTRSASQSL